MAIDRLALVLLLAAAALLLMPPAVPPEDADDEPDYQAPDLIDAAVSVAQEAQDMLSTESDEVKNQNEQAFLWSLRVSEGTSGPDGYRTIVGGSTFDSFADHPHVLIPLPNLGISSSAAGAYQIIRRTWDGVRAKLGLPDFSPASQDAAALELIRQRGAQADVRAGRFAVAIDKCKKEWASLPGAGYGQHENTLATLQSAYTIAGGYIA
jgi:muramidase (phage lysozyme)